MKLLVSLFISALFVGVLATDGVAGGDKSASGQDKSSHDASASPSTSGQDKSGQDASASPSLSGQDKSGQDASASPSTSGQDKPATLPAPVSKDECTSDGWSKLGFSSEQDCLNSVKP